MKATIRDVSSRIVADVTRAGEGIKAAVSNATSPLLATVQDVAEHIRASVANASPTMAVSISDAVDAHLKVKVSILCTLEEVVYYLKITPEEIQWITDDMGVYFDVNSNVEWIIETS